MKRNGLYVSIVGRPIAAMTCAAALAGGATAQAGTDEDVIIVTAQKREQNVQEVPASVQVLQGRDLSPAVNTLDQLLTVTPTLNFKRGGTPLDSSLFLRGVGTINFSIAAEPSVATVVDGIVLARAGEAFSDLYDIDRIEVLPGPQSTLFGKNASAGVINIVTTEPGETFGGYTEFAGFDDSEYKARFAVDAPFSDALRTRLTGFFGTYDGNVTNLFDGDRVNGYERWGARATAVWDASERLTFTVRGDYRETDDDGTTEIIGTAPPPGPNQAALLSLLSGVDLSGDDTRQVRNDLTNRSQEEGWGGSVQVDYDLGGDFTLTSITAYRSWSIFGARDGDWLDRPAAYVGAAFAQLHDLGRPQDSSTFTEELRIASPAGERLEYVAGLFYYAADAERIFRRDVTVCTATTLAPDATGLAPCSLGSSTFVSGFSEATFGSEFENFAVFGDASYDLTDQLTLIAGLRFAQDDLSVRHDRIPSLVALPGIRTDTTGFRDETESDNVSGRVGAQYALTEGILGYATYSRGYKGPAFNVFFNQNADQRNVIEGEDVDAYEAGLKTTSLDSDLVLNLAAFYAEYDNFQANSFDVLNGVVITRLTNAGEISTRGFELEGAYQPVDAFTLTGGVAYADAQIERFRAPDGTLSDARQGERIALAPEWKLTLAANYAIEPGSLPFGVDLNLQYAYTDEQFSDIGANPALLIDSYDALDGRITFSDPEGELEFSIIGRNLTDESFASLITPGGPGGALRYQIPREADRFFGVALTTRFGG
jgi:iron complex outermembrane receptor protein